MNIKQTLEAIFEQAMIGAGVSEPRPIIKQSQRAEFGHYQANGVMAAAKQLKLAPRDLAQAILDHLPLQNRYTFEIAGPGFINIRLTHEGLTEAVASTAFPVNIGVDAPKRVVVDYSSPNLAKEMHIGHLRSTVIGDTVIRVLEHVGHDAIRANHVGDWGAQFGSLLAYLSETGHNEQARTTALADLEKFYQAASKKFKQDPAFAEKARGFVVQLQAGDPELKALWQSFIATSMSHGQAVYDKLGITLTQKDAMPESQYNDDLVPLVEDLKDKNLIEESDGAQCVFLDEFKGKDGNRLPAMVQKSDGGFPYLATDLAALRFRHRVLEANEALYVVGASQQLHLRQVFAVARAAGFVPETLKTRHLAFGLVLKADGTPFKTRDGADVKLVDVLDEAVDRATALLSARDNDLDQQEQATIARVIGIGAIKYAELQKNRTTDYVFDWDTMLSFEGNTAPYLQYAYTRIRSLFRKSGLAAPDSNAEITLTEPQEAALALKNLQFSEALTQYLDDYQANILCNYLFELAGSFMTFYEHCPILGADADLKASRLRLSQITSETLSTGLNLLGIETVERM
jgi:arginyl-tRNA synthetase